MPLTIKQLNRQLADFNDLNTKLVSYWMQIEPQANIPAPEQVAEHANDIDSLGQAATKAKNLNLQLLEQLDAAKKRTVLALRTELNQLNQSNATLMPSLRKTEQLNNAQQQTENQQLENMGDWGKIDHYSQLVAAAKRLNTTLKEEGTAYQLFSLALNQYLQKESRLDPEIYSTVSEKTTLLKSTIQSLSRCINYISMGNAAPNEIFIQRIKLYYAFYERFQQEQQYDITNRLNIILKNIHYFNGDYIRFTQDEFDDDQTCIMRSIAAFVKEHKTEETFEQNNYKLFIPEGCSLTENEKILIVVNGYKNHLFALKRTQSVKDEIFSLTKILEYLEKTKPFDIPAPIAQDESPAIKDAKENAYAEWKKYLHKYLHIIEQYDSENSTQDSQKEFIKTLSVASQTLTQIVSPILKLYPENAISIKTGMEIYMAFMTRFDNEHLEENIYFDVNDSLAIQFSRILYPYELSSLNELICTFTTRTILLKFDINQPFYTLLPNDKVELQNNELYKSRVYLALVKTYLNRVQTRKFPANLETEKQNQMAALVCIAIHLKNKIETLNKPNHTQARIINSTKPQASLSTKSSEKSAAKIKNI